MTTPRILIYDLETAPNLGFTWGKWDQNVIKFVREWRLLTVSWKWRGEKRAHVLGLDDYEDYVPGELDDSGLAAHLWYLLDEADITVTHNGKAFDKKKAMARFVELFPDSPPPSPTREIDTLLISRKHFDFTSHALADIADRLGLRAKGHPGFGVWEGCINGDPAAWRKMKAYCRNDVEIEEQVYERFMPYMDARDHPNLALYGDRPTACPRCLAEGTMIIRGYRNSTVTRKTLYQCRTCGAYAAGRPIEKPPLTYVP